MGNVDKKGKNDRVLRKKCVRSNYYRKIGKDGKNILRKCQKCNKTIVDRKKKPHLFEKWILFSGFT